MHNYYYAYGMKNRGVKA